MNTLDNIEVDITVELGAAIMPVHHLLRMGRGAVIELDTGESDPLRVYANNTLIARGEARQRVATLVGGCKRLIAVMQTLATKPQSTG